MSSFISTLLFLFITASGITPAVNQTSEATEPMCYDWGESSVAGVRVLEGEVGWLSCPLFSHPSVYRFSSGHNLFWYRLPDDHDLEQPITYSLRLSRDRERLWLQPAEASDTGLYICMLRNKSSCSKISMRLSVLRPADVPRRTVCEPAVAVATTLVQIPLQEGNVLDCPDLQDIANMTDGQTSVSWSYVHLQGQRCYQTPFASSDRQQRGLSLVFHVMYDNYQGLYFCSVSYQRRGQTLNYTRSLNVIAVSPTNLPKFPSIIHPAKDQVFTVERGADVQLLCRAEFPHLKSQWTSMWWTVDGQTLDKLSDSQRFSVKHSLEKEDHGDRMEVSELLITDFLSGDVHRDFSCSVRNERGNETRRAQLEEKVELPVLELGCGLAVTLVLMLVLFVIYHVFWLELLLLYRSWFGTDERHMDDKQYDVYISYARNSDEEQFVLSTLRRVLENELGYTVCIFDRDSLPGGTITDETLGFVARSRRLLVVVSPGYACQGSQALLELQAGIDSMARGGHLRVILVQYQPVQSRSWVRELRRARLALALVRWQGDKSRELTSAFWKRLRVELPVRRVSHRDQEDPVLLRLNSKSSTGVDPHKEPRRVLNSAA